MRFVKLFALIAGTLGLLVMGVSFGVYSLWNDAGIASNVSRWISNPLAGRGGPAQQAFTFGRIHYEWLPAVRSLFLGYPVRAEAYDVGIWDPEGNEVLYTPHATVSLRLDQLLWNLFGGMLPGRKDDLELHLLDAEIETARCRIGTITTGQVNLVAAMSKRVQKPPSGGGMVISLDRAVIHDGSFTMGFAGWEAKLPHLTAVVDSLRYSSFPSEQLPEKPSFVYRVRSVVAPEGTLVLGSFKFPLEQIVTTTFHAEDPDRQHLAFVGSARTLGASVTVEGKLLDMYSDHAGVDLVLRAEHGGGLVDLLPVAELVAGDPSGDAHIHGKFSHVVIEGALANAEIHLARVAAAAVTTRYRLENGILALSDVNGSLGGGQIAGQVQVDFNTLSWGADLRTRGVDPGLLQPLVPLSARNLVGGLLDGRAHAGGSIAAHPERVHVQSLDATLVRRARDHLPTRIVVHGNLSAASEKILFDDFSASAEGVTAKISGAINYQNLTVDSRLEIDSTTLDPLLARFEFPSVVRGVKVDAHATGKLAEPTVDGTLIATDVGEGDRRIPRLDAHVRFEHGTLSASQLHAQGFGGDITGTLALGLFDGPFTRRLTEPSVAVDVDVEHLRVHTLLNLPAVHGELSGKFRLGGTIHRPVGRASLALPSLTVYDDPYHDGTFEAAINEHGVDIQKIALARTGGGTFAANGHVGWDGALDVQVVPSSFPLLAIPALRSVPVALAGILSGVVHLGGSLGHWVPEGFVEAIAVRIRDIPFGDGEVTLKAEPPIVPYAPETSKIHLQGDFFKRFGFAVEGTLSLSPSIAGDITIRFADLPLNEIVPEMKKLAEVEGKATGSAHIQFDLLAGKLDAELRLKKLLLTFRSDESDELDDGSEPAVDTNANGATDATIDTPKIAATDGDKRAARRAPDEFRNDDDVVIGWDGQSIRFTQVHLRSRMGELEVRGQLSPTESDATVRGQLELRLLEYFAQRLFAHTHGQAFADIRIRGPMARPHLTGTLDLRDAGVAPQGADRLFKVPEGRLLFDDTGITLRHLRLRLDGLESEAEGRLVLTEWVPHEVSLSLAGDVSPTLLAWLFPDHIGEPAGRLGVDLQVSGSFPHPTWQAVVQVHELFFHEKALSRDVQLRGGTIALNNMRVTIGCPAATISSSASGPGPATNLPIAGASAISPATCRALTARIDDSSALRVEGGFVLGGPLLEPHMETVDVRIDGENLDWGKSGMFSITFSPHVELSGDKDQLRLAGTLSLVNGRYYQDFDVNVLSLLAAPRTVESDPPFYKGIALLENLELDLEARSSGPLFIKDNLADLSVSVPSLEIGGTLAEPRFLGTIYVEPGGRFRVPFLRADFVSDQGAVVFEKDKRFPDGTPSLNVSAAADWMDRYEQVHHILLNIRGTYRLPFIDLSSTDGWDKQKVLVALATGSTPDDIRRAAQGTTASTSSVGGQSNFSDGLLKEAVGNVLSRTLEDPLKAVTKFDLIRLELGYDSVVVKVCPVNKPAYKLCGTGDVGLVGSTSRYEARGELKLSEEFSVGLSAERILNGIDTSESDLTRLRGQFTLKRPIF